MYVHVCIYMRRDNFSILYIYIDIYIYIHKNVCMCFCESGKYIYAHVNQFALRGRMDGAYMRGCIDGLLDG